MLKSLLLTLTLLGLLTSCRATAENTRPDGELAFYLLTDNTFLSSTVNLSQLELAPEPLLSLADIVSYTAATHEISLTPAAVERLEQSNLPGLPFVVTVEQRPIYAGEFMALTFSRSSERVVILWPPLAGAANTIQLQLGYPGPDFFRGDDPRADARVIEALSQAGKLK